jgi:hypothetical protein
MDPHSFEKLDPDPHSPKKLDPDPHKVNADTKHWQKLLGTNTGGLSQSSIVN